MAKFEKGQSGNPGGRPKEVAEVRELAREHTPAAIATLAAIMNDPNARDAARVAAAKELLDRGYGRPTQALDVTNNPPLQQLVIVRGGGDKTIDHQTPAVP